MTRSITPKLRIYVILAAVAAFAGLASGRIELLAVSAPFVIAMVLGLATGTPPLVSLDLTIETDRCIEGDDISICLRVKSNGFTGEIEAGITLPAGFDSEGANPATMSLEPGEEARHEVVARVLRWGAHMIGPAAVRLSGPGRLIVYEKIADDSFALKVYPSAERLKRGIVPPHTQLYSGDYVARAAGEGIEFAAIREFASGDNIRRVNWRVTSRRDELHVNLAHPERDGDVVLFLDTFTNVDLTHGTTLDLTVRGASAIALHHLRHNDRVGLIGFGGMLRWLTASMGRMHVYRIADFLLDVGTTFSYAWKAIDLLPPNTLPPNAFVIAFTALDDRRAVRAIADIAGRGFAIAVVDTLQEDQVASEATPEGRLAHRMWKLQREAQRDELRALGVPVSKWTGGAALDSILAQIPRRRRPVTGGSR